MTLVPAIRKPFINKLIDNVVIPMVFGALGFAFVLLITTVFILSK